MENVELWYRYSTDNLGWGSWTSFGTDNDNSDGWSWSFTGSDGYYEFYSIARDNDGNVEPAPAEADARCGVDTVSPTITSIVINDNADLTSLTSVTLSIVASDATSGLAEMRFSSNNVDWSGWESFATSKSYTLPAGDGLKTVYVQVKDKAGLSSTVASDSITLETVLPPPEGALTVTIGTLRAGETGSADFTQYGIVVTKVRITPEHGVSDVKVYVVAPCEPAGVPAISLPVYSRFCITTNIDAAEVRSATIEFQVPRYWIAQMNIDNRTIRLLRLNGGWHELPTNLVGADPIYFYYEAVTSGFSLFAVMGERLVVPPPVEPIPPVPPPPVPPPPVPPSPTPPVAPVVPPPVAPPLFLYAVLFTMAGVVGFAAAYRLLVRPSKYYVMLKRLKRAVVRPKARRIGKPLPKPPARVRRQVSPAELAALRRLESIARKRKRKFARERD